MTVVAVVPDVPEVAMAVEGELVSVAVDALVLRGRPEVAVVAHVVDTRAVTGTRRRQEDTVTVGANNKLTIYPIIRCPFPRTH